MNIYISHSTSFEYERELYLPIKNSPLYSLHHITFPHERSSKPFDTKNYLATCDLVIAEVSYPSTGQGIELGWANMMGIRIIAIHKNQAKISTSIQLVASVIIPYQTFEEAIVSLTNKLPTMRNE